MERLLKEGSSADEPINIPLSDYSSDEGSSICSDNEGKGSTNDFSDLEGPCCQPLKVPPSSPELDVELRKLRYSRMRKIMQELDRIYFQPMFRKKWHFLIKMNRFSKFKSRQQRKVNTKSENLNSDSQAHLNKHLQTINKDDEINTIALQYAASSFSSNMGNTESSTSVNTLKHHKSESIKKRKRRSKRSQELDKKPLVKVSRKIRLWLRKRQIFIVRRKMVNRKNSLVQKRDLKVKTARIWR